MWRKSRAMEEKIRIENVTKKFGSYAALDGISLNFEKGKIHGIIGRNGSGKTVLFKCICGFLRVDGGAVLVNGKQVGKEIEAPESIGAIIETPGFLPGYTQENNGIIRHGAKIVPASAGKSERKRSTKPSEKSAWTRKRKSTSANIPSVCASASASHRQSWKIRPF